MTFLRAFAVALTVLSVSLPLQAKDADGLRQRAEKIRNNRNYYSASGYGDSVDRARRSAVEELCSSISRSVSIVSSSHDTEDSESFDSKAYVSTYVTLNNTETITLSDRAGACEVLIYVEKTQVDNDMAMRAENIKSLAAQGRELEKRLEIASAIKYYSWALALSGAYIKPVMLEIDGMNHNARTWLHAHLGTMLNTLEFELDDVEEHPGELDPYTVNLNVRYLGREVGDLQFSYMNNGNRIANQHAKNGKASLAFERLPKEAIELSVEYRYEDEVKGYDAELAAVFAAGHKVKLPQANIKVSCKGADAERFAIKDRITSREEKKQAEQDALLAPAVAGKQRKRIETVAAGSDVKNSAIQSMTAIKDALENHDYSAVSKLFTTDGYSLFMRMVRSGRIKPKSGNPVFSVEVAGDYVVGKSIPVTIKYKGGHSATEEIVCRFNRQGLIESVAYALSRRAEDDIFRQNSWSLHAAIQYCTSWRIIRPPMH